MPFAVKVILVLVPFVWLFVGILGTRLKTFTVTLIAMVVTTGLALLGWGVEWSVIGVSYLEGIVIALVPIIWVIVAAVFTYEVGVRTHAMERLQAFLGHLSPEPAIQAVLIAFGLGGFLESVAGFGTAVAIPSAMLVGMGFTPLRAVLIALVANSVPVAFGALGIPVVVLSRITELPLAGLSRAIAVQLGLFSCVIPLVIVALAKGERRVSLVVWLQALLLGVVFTLLQTVVAFFVGPELVAVLASLGVMVTGVMFRPGVLRSHLDQVAVAMAPYGFLLVLVLFTRLASLPWLRAFPLVFSWSLEGHTITVEWLTTPGTLLFLATLLGSRVQKASWGLVGEALVSTLKKLQASMVTIASIVVMAKVMGNTPMIGDLSSALAMASGRFFPFLSPLLGALGTFVTGSDTSSNILLGKLQRDTATGLMLDPTWVAAANTSGATAGKMISPQSIAVASSAVGLQGSEGKILARSLWFCLVYVGVLGILIGTVAWL